VLVIDPAKHEVTIVNAGHMSPKWYKAASDELVDAISLDATGLPVGALPGYPFEQVTFTLELNDSVALFTDGVTDAMNPAGAMFGQEAVDRYLAPDDSALAAEAQRAKRVGERLVAAVRTHANGRAQNDDIAVVAFGRTDATSGPITGLNKVQTSRHNKIGV
jgi:sigma-B regulation protein RsbU (phosphoserine phosphatase)